MPAGPGAPPSLMLATWQWEVFLSDGTLRHVVIVGGGTAGWLTAGILAADHRAHAPDGLKVTLVESPNVAILGVGEGTWPSLRDTLRRIGLSETEFLRRTQASFKQGSRFDGWVSGAPGDSYLHPFDPLPSQDDLDALSLWRAAAGSVAFAEAVSAQAALCAEGRAPKQVQTPEFAAVANYAYHLDAPAFAELLREHCTARLGVQHVRADVTGVRRCDDGRVLGLDTDCSGAIDGDLFVDCTGARALLIEGALGVESHDVSDMLFNDAALAVHVPDTGPVPSQTNATAMPAGWVWDIALQSRRGVGHVFSTRHMDEAEARDQLSSYLERLAPGTGVTGNDARLIRFRSAYRATPWRGNVVAIGMSQGFVEPLEASAIVMIELSAAMLSDLLPPRLEGVPNVARRFNERFSYRWERIIDFLKLHYIPSQRTEAYWRDHRDPATWPSRLRELLEQWRHVPPSRDDFAHALEIFPAASYAYVLYGMGFETAPRPHARRKDLADRARQRLGEIAVKRQKMLAGLPGNREWLATVLGIDTRTGLRRAG